MTSSLATVSYIGATILFILSLGGPPTQRPSLAPRQPVRHRGMSIAVLATVFGPQVGARRHSMDRHRPRHRRRGRPYAAKKVQMTQMPELVALMHSLVGLAACLVGFCKLWTPSLVFPPPPRRPSTRWRSTSAS